MFTPSAIILKYVCKLFLLKIDAIDVGEYTWIILRYLK